MDYELNRFGQPNDKRPLITQSTSYNPLIIPTERRTKAGLWQRSSPLCLLLLATTLSVVPGSLQWTGKTYGSNSALYKWATDDRAVLQVVIQIIAAVLAFLWTYSVCLALNLTLRPLLAERRIPVSTLRLCAAISRKAFDLNLPVQLMLVSALVYGVALLPSWFWTGALTPQTVSRTVSLNGSLVAPNTGSGSYPFLQDPKTNIISAGCRGAPQTNGSFTTCPGGIYPGHVIDSMGQVSNFEAGTWNHSKFDSSGYTYTNRSYGVGAGVGLQPTPDLGAMYGYEYQELGYLTSAKCAYNDSSAWFLTNSTTDSPLGTPNIFWAEGMRPNDDWDAMASSAGYTMWNYGDKPAEVVAFSAGGCCHFNNGTAPYYLSIAAGIRYGILDKVQCTFDFTPTLFNVSVSVANRTIHVQPDSTAEHDPEPRGQMREWALRQLQAAAQTSTTLYVSTIGEAMGTNIRRHLNNASTSFVEPRDDALPAIENSVQAAVDDILVGFGGFALTQSGNYSAVDTTYEVSAIKIGTLGFAIAILVVNAVGFLVVFALTATTRLFSRSPAFDFADLGGMVAGTALGRAGAEANVTYMGPAGHEAGAAVWNGDPGDKFVGRSTVTMHCGLGDGAGRSPFVEVVRAR